MPTVIPDARATPPSKYHGAIGRAILPFARSLILLLRACSSVVKQRQKKGGTENAVESTEGKMLDQILVHDEMMTYEDGFLILRELGGPLPSSIVAQAPNSSGNDMTWRTLVQRWLVAVKGLELHHGSRGNNIIPWVDPDITFKTAPVSRPSKNEDHSQSTESDFYGSGGTGQFDDSGDEDQVMHDAGDHVEELAADAPEVVESVDMLDMDMENSEEEMVGFAEQALGEAVTAAIARNSAGTDVYDDSSEDGSFDGTSMGGGARLKDAEKEFAFVSRSPIIPHQPSLLGVEIMGPGTRGAPFDVEAASLVMRDLSHLGMIHRKGKLLSQISLCALFSCTDTS